MARKVCIIDDNQDILGIYKKKFTDEGFETFTTSDSDRGLEIIRQVNPDILLLDLQMPGKDGFQVLQILNAEDRLGVMPIILFTNIDSDVILGRIALFPTKFDLLIKSMITPTETVEYVRNVLNRAKEKAGGAQAAN